MTFTLENFKNAKSTDTFTFVCKYCGEEFEVTKRYIQRNSMKLPIYCSKECSYKDRSTKIKEKCSYCGSEIEITQKQYDNSISKRFFCSNSCAAKYNNKNRVITDEQKAKTSRTLQAKYLKNKFGESCEDAYINSLIKEYSPSDTICPICGGKKTASSDKCQKCKNEELTNSLLDRTLGDFVSDSDTYKTHKCTTIRKLARRIMENSDIEKKCYFCKDHEFDDILEVHHLKNIMSFSLDTKIRDINSLDNMIWVCPNHHKMLERGLIKYK
jgi:hypothetical protein